MRMSKEAKDLIYYDFIRAYQLKDGLGSKVKFNLLLNKLKNTENKLINVFESNNTKVSPEKSKNVKDCIGIDEVYGIILSIYPIYKEKGLEDFFAQSKDGKLHEMIDGFCSQYNAKVFEKANQRLSSVEKAYYASKLDINFGDLSFETSQWQRSDFYPNDYLRKFKDISNETISFFISDNVDSIYDLDCFYKYISRQSNNFDEYKEAIQNSSNPKHKELRLQALKVLSSVVSEDELKYYEENKEYSPQTIAKLKLGLVPELLERIHQGELSKEQQQTIKDLISNSKALSQSWGMDDITNYLNVIWNYKDLVEKFDLEAESTEQNRILEIIQRVSNMSIAEISENPDVIKEELSDISLSVEAIQREDMIERLSTIPHHESDQNISLLDGKSIDINATYVDNPQDVGILLASFITSDKLGTIPTKERIIEEANISPFTDELFPDEEYHYCTTIFTPQAAAKGGHRGNIFFIYDKNSLKPEDIILSMESHSPTNTYLYDLFGIKNSDIISPGKTIIENQINSSSMFSYRESETDIDVNSTPAAMGILYSKEKNNCSIEDFKALQTYANEHHLPIVIYDMDEIADKLDKSNNKDNKHTKGFDIDER